MAGGLDVHKNKYVEDWGTARENLEKSFRFTRKNITLALIFGIAVPFITYKGITGEFVSTWVVLNLSVLGRSHVVRCFGVVRFVGLKMHI